LREVEFVLVEGLMTVFDKNGRGFKPIDTAAIIVGYFHFLLDLRDQRVFYFDKRIMGLVLVVPVPNKVLVVNVFGYVVYIVIVDKDKRFVVYKRLGTNIGGFGGASRQIVDLDKVNCLFFEQVDNDFLEIVFF
jgi:hypothetical protein